MIRPPIHIDARQGNTLRLAFTIYANSAKTTRMVLTGKTLVFRATWAGGEIRKESPTDITITAESQGEASLSLTPAETREMPCDNSVKYELELRGDGDEDTVAHGDIRVAYGVNDDA